VALLFFILNRQPNVLNNSCKNMAIALAIKENTMAKPRMYLRRNSNKTSLALMVTSEMLYIFSTFIIKSSIHAVFSFVSLRDRIFILFLLVTWPEYLFLKRKFQIPLRIKWPSPKRHICGHREGEVPFFVLGYRQVNTS
jgi:hypothetical protein